MRLLALGSLLLAGCASFAPTVAPGYTGPLAVLRDTAVPKDHAHGELYHLASIDGKDVYSSLQRTYGDNAGRGFGLRFSMVQHTVPAAPIQIRIKGTHMTGAPIQAIAMQASGQFHKVEKDVRFTPVAGGDYRITGVLSPQGSDVWIEETQTGRRVTP